MKTGIDIELIGIRADRKRATIKVGKVRYSIALSLYEKLIEGSVNMSFAQKCYTCPMPMIKQACEQWKPKY